MKEFKFYAFISYKREDEKWARWLQRRLETYRLPATVRKAHPLLPSKVVPIFRDKTDLGAGILDSNLVEALKVSKYLIVICSPKSAKSEWVGKEIDEFVSSGRTEMIIPFIVSGKPFGNDGEECFHDVIKNAESGLLGISVPELGRNIAFVKTVARLLDLQFDELWRREKRRQTRRRIRKWIVAAFFLGCFVGLFEFIRPRATFYNSISYFSDGWRHKGLDEVSPEEVRHMNRHIEVIRSCGKVDRIVECNSAFYLCGNLTVFDDTHVYGNSTYYPEIYTYRTNGSLEEVMVVGGQNFDRVDVKDGNYTSFSKPISSDTPGDDPTDIRRLALTRDERGFVTRVEYKKYNGEDGVPAKGANGEYGTEYTLDSTGHIMEAYFLDQNGNTGYANRYGIAGYRQEYDSAGNVVKFAYFGKEGKPAEDKDGIAESEYTFDTFHNCLSAKLHDRNGNPIADNAGVFGYEFGYDDRGFRIMQRYIGCNSEPVIHSDEGCHMVRNEYDERGFRTKASSFGTDGQPCVNKFGYSIAGMEYDSYTGWITSTEYYGTDSKRCLDGYGCFRREFCYDDRGNIIKTTNFGTDGLLCLNTEGWAIQTSDFDMKSKVRTLSYFGTDSLPCLTSDGIDVEKQFLGDRGEIVKWVFFGLDGPIENRNGIHSGESQFNGKGQRTMLAFKNLNGNPAEDGYGVAVYEYEYDDDGALVKETRYDAQGNSVDSDNSVRYPGHSLYNIDNE